VAQLTISDTEYGARTFDGFEDRIAVAHVGAHDLATLLFESDGGGFGDIASDGADFVGLGEDGVAENGLDDGATLVACGTEDGEEFGHDVNLEVEGFECRSIVL
jgi:hypothetical protein